MRHELLRIPQPLPVFRHNTVSIHCYIDSLVHFVRDHLSDEGPTGVVSTGWVVNEVPARDGGHVGKFIVGHFFEVDGWGGDWSSVVVGG